MTIYTFVHKHRFIVMTGLITAIILFGASASSAAPGDEYKKMPGYVDFEAMGVLDNAEASVEIYLKGPLLKLCREAVRHDEPELADLLQEVKYVRVQVFPVERDDTERVTKKAGEVAKSLEKKGWEVAVRVREDEDNVYIYVLPGKDDKIDGLVVMAIEDRGDAVFINIVGTIDPEQLGKMHFDLDDLDDIRWDLNFLQDRDTDYRLVLDDDARVRSNRRIKVRVR